MLNIQQRWTSEMGFVQDDEYWEGTADRPGTSKKTESPPPTSLSSASAACMVPFSCRKSYTGDHELRLIRRDMSNIQLNERNSVPVIPVPEVPQPRGKTVTFLEQGKESRPSAVAWSDHPDHNWKSMQSIQDKIGEDSDDDDHLDHGISEERKAGGINGFKYDPRKYRPRRDRSGGLVYSSFIPPIPSKVSPNTYAIRPTLESEVVQESSEAIKARILENMRNAKYFIKDQSILTVSECPFNARFLGVSPDSCAILKFLDRESRAHYADVQQSLGMYFSSKSGAKNIVMPVEEMENGRIVLAEIGRTKYIRAMILKVEHDEGTVEVRNCDEWEYKTVPIDCISYMHPHFMEFPFVVQKCKLKRLDLWFNSRVLSEIAPMLPGVEDIVRVTECEIDVVENVPVVLLETKVKGKKGGSGGTDPEEPVYLNDLFLDFIKGFTRVPKTFIRGVIIEKAHVSIIEDNGEIWIQMHSALSAHLARIGENPEKCMVHYPELLGLEKPISDFEHSFFNLKDRRFLARFKDDRAFYRVEVFKVNQENKKATVRYLDFGNMEIISIDDIIPTAFVDPALNEIPLQIFKAVLNGIDCIVDADQFFDYIGVGILQRFVVAGFHAPGVPLLELYAQLDPQTPEKWIFVNQFILDKGIATGPGVQYPMPIRLFSSNSPGSETPAEKRMKERMRFLSTCHILESET